MSDNVDRLFEVKALIKELRQEQKELTERLISEIDEDLETGVNNLILEGVPVKVTVPKKVEWDQEKMKQEFIRLYQSGEQDPFSFMDIKFSVQENRYRNYGERLRGYIDHARSVDDGSPTIKEA